MFAVLDVETTGLRPARDRIVEIAIVRVDEGGSLVDEWCTLVNPGRAVGSVGVHRISRREIRDAPTFSEIVGDVFHRIDGHVLVAHNARFDAAMVHAEWHRAGHTTSVDWFCTLQLARRVGFGTQRSLRGCCENLGVTHDDGHDALVDSRATANLLGFLLAAAHEREIAIEFPGVVRADLTRVAPCGVAVRRKPPPPSAAPLRRLVGRSTTPTSAAAEAASCYLGLLDTILEDRQLTSDEVTALVELANSWGLGLEDVRVLHELYATQLVEAALADGVLSRDEHRDLAVVAELLGVRREHILDQLERLLP